MPITGDPLNYTEQGNYTVVWTFIDSNSNIVQIDQAVIVDDVTAPVTPTLADLIVACSVTPTAPTTTDSCEGTITGTTTTTFPITADTTVTWTFNDGNGNSTTADQNVIVSGLDNTPPVLAGVPSTN